MTGCFKNRWWVGRSEKRRESHEYECGFGRSLRQDQNPRERKKRENLFFFAIEREAKRWLFREYLNGEG